MDSDSKMIVWMMVLVVALPMVGLGLVDYQKSQCKLTAITAHMPAGEIEKVCK